MNKVTVYSTTDCGYCVMVKNFLKEEGVPYQEVNIDNNPEAVQLLLRETGRMGAPQTNVNGNWVVGYDRNKIRKALRG